MDSLFSLLKKHKQATGQQKQPAADGIMSEEAAMKVIEERLCARYRGNPGVIAGQTVVVHVNDGLMYPIVKSREFHDRLLHSIASSGLNLYDVEFTDDPVPENATKISDSISAVIKKNPVQPDNKAFFRQATISIYNGKGSLANDSYTIAAEECPYFIGRDNAFLHRDKAITVQGDKDAPLYELNKFVRSRHAQVHFQDSLGFYLLVEKDGSRVYGGNRTQIRRKGEIIELDNPLQPVPLCHDDVVILGKSVELLFSEVKA